MMTDTSNFWTEADSHLYQEIASIAVPNRADQIAALLTLLPLGPDEPFRAVEVASGQGLLAAALLQCFPQATLLALDGSEEMRSQTAKRMEPFNGRGKVAPFELSSEAWYSYLDGADCVLSSLCIHHLTGLEKQALFWTIYPRLSARGTLLIADLVEPQRREAQTFFAATWDHNAQAQAKAQGQPELFDKFAGIGWNIYRFPDPVDQPSPLFHQLLWLKEAGFATVDCFWLQAGHAIYGGYKGTNEDKAGGLSYEAALQTANALLKQA
jgi:tRNA (cmo5U34)-methyltransferase